MELWILDCHNMEASLFDFIGDHVSTMLERHAFLWSFDAEKVVNAEYQALHEYFSP